MKRIRDFKSVVVFSGAGMSAESGVPTYRGQGGLWHAYNWQEYACQQAFDRDPEGVWEFHTKRRAAVQECAPHKGHDILVEMEKHFPKFTVVTQNIDGMHQRAGSSNVHELHGSLWRVRCSAEKTTVDALDHPMASLKCDCGAWLRPDIVWFEDPIKSAVFHLAKRAIQNCDLFISVGTSGVVFPAARLPEEAHLVGAHRIEVNPEENEGSHYYNQHLRGPASEMLAKLWA